MNGWPYGMNSYGSYGGDCLCRECMADEELEPTKAMEEQCKSNVEERTTCPTCAGTGCAHRWHPDPNEAFDCCNDCSGFGYVYPEDLQKPE